MKCVSQAYHVIQQLENIFFARIDWEETPLLIYREIQDSQESFQPRLDPCHWTQA